MCFFFFKELEYVECVVSIGIYNKNGIQRV